MAVTFTAPTCWPVQGWAVFRFTQGSWRLVMVRRYAFLIPPLVAVGAGIRETAPVFRQGDNRCNPSGGRQARIWRWNGSRFTATPWKVTPAKGKARTAAEFFSPSRNLGCEVSDDVNGARAACLSFRPPLDVTMGLDGRLKICRGCTGNLGEGAFVLAYGKQVTIGRFRCFSMRSGMKCIVIRTGKGFMINAAGVTKVGQ